QKLLEEMDTFAHQRARDILTQALPRAASALSSATLTTTRPSNAEALAEDTRRKAATRIIAFITGQTPRVSPTAPPTVPPRSPTPNPPGDTSNTTSCNDLRTPTNATSVLPTCDAQSSNDHTTTFPIQSDLQTLNITLPLPPDRDDLPNSKPETP